MLLQLLRILAWNLVELGEFLAGVSRLMGAPLPISASLVTLPPPLLCPFSSLCLVETLVIAFRAQQDNAG